LHQLRGASAGGSKSLGRPHMAAATLAGPKRAQGGGDA